MPLPGVRIALQEYGVSNRELIRGLEARGALVTPVPVYQWALPEDIGPLQRAIQEIVDGNIDVLLITSANQIQSIDEINAVPRVWWEPFTGSACRINGSLLVVRGSARFSGETVRPVAGVRCSPMMDCC